MAVMAAPLRLPAQTLQASLSHYSTENGMKSDAIAHIIQDDYGYIWIATWNGLSRFDGYHFYNYPTGNISHIPYLHNRIMDLTTDLSQNIWMRMYDGRVFVVNRRRDIIVNPFKGIGNSEEYRTSIPLFSTSAGDVLASIDGVGIYKLRLNDDKIDAQLITAPGLKVTCMAEGYHDDIWVGTDKGVHRMDLGNLSVERKSLFEDEQVSCLYSNGFNIFVGTASGRILLFAYGQDPKTLRQATGKEILSVFVDSQGAIWFADTSVGAYKLNPETGQEHHYEQRVLVPEHDGRGGVFRENNGTVWVRMNQGGYGYYNRQTDEVEYFHNDPVNPWNLSNTVNASLELEEGVVFVSTSRRALEKLEILKKTISRTLLLPDAESTIENEIRAMHYDTKRKLLIMGNKNNTIFLIHDDGSRTTINTDSKGNSLGRIYGISQDSKGNYWLSSKDNGLFRMSPKEGGGYDIQNFRNDPNDKWSLSSDAAYASVEDRHGNIWIATYGGGVNVLMKNKEGKYVMKNRNNEMRSYPRNSHLKMRTIAIDKEGNVWAGSTDGILIFNTNNGKINISRLEESEQYPNSILMSNDIVYLARDKQGSMWAGTNGGGLSHTTGKDSDGRWLFETFDSNSGLPSEEIKSITFDKSDNVWFATDHVLCSFDVQKKIFTTFSSLDGVDETMCSEGSALTLPNGNILFGTLNGYYTIDRKKLITNNGALIKLRITDFILNDEIQSPRLNNNFDYYVPDAKRVVLPGHNNVFAFRFTSLNYQLQHRVHYQYMLEGYEHEWQNATKERTASYANIPTGTYHFKVKAFLLDSPDKYDMRSIEVVVPPYFFFSRNAVWLYMLIAIAAGIGLMFWRQEQLSRRERMKVLKMAPLELEFDNDADLDFVRQQMDWLEQNYSNPAVSADKMAAQAGMSREAYDARLKKLIGQTPGEMVTDFRLKKAAMYLEKTNEAISDVALKTGFDDPVYFTRLFKAKLGVPPSKYREDAQASKPATAETTPAPNTATDDGTDAYEIIE